MSGLWWEIIIIFLLTFLNGFFAGSELALISLRKTRLTALQRRSPKRTEFIRKLQQNPETFIATTQIGISVATIISSAFAGQNLEQHIAPFIKEAGIPFFSAYAEKTSFFVIIIIVSYLTIVLGELVPKSFALRHAEKVALWAAYPLYYLSRASALIIKFVTFSSNLILRPFNDSATFIESKLSEEELRSLLYEGRKAGTIEKREHEMLQNVFEFSDMTVGRIMTPRSQVMACNTEDPVKQSLKAIIDSGYTRIPFYKNTLDTIVGILHTKDLLAQVDNPKGELSLRDLLRPPFYVPATQKISDLLQNFQKKKAHMAMVINEHGEVDGLVTLEDVIEEIVGEIADETDEASTDILKQKDGSHIVSGSVSVIDFNRFFKSAIPENEMYSTISGFMLDQLERFPEVGDKASVEDLIFTINERTPRTVKSVVVQRDNTPTQP